MGATGFLTTYTKNVTTGTLISPVPTGTFILKQFQFDLVVLLFGAVRLLKFGQLVRRYYYSGGTFIKIWPIGSAVLLFGWYHYSALESTYL